MSMLRRILFNEFEIRKPYDLGFRQEAKIGEDDLTKQSFKDECDINIIMARYAKTGVLEHQNFYQPRYEDVSEMPDYLTAINVVRMAEDAFSALPADVRIKFDNDPALFVQFVDNPSNRDEAEKLGILRPSEGKQVGVPPAQAAEGDKGPSGPASGDKKPS